MRTDTTVRDVMHREFLGVSEADTVSQAAALLVDEGTNCLVVLRGGEPVGRLGCQAALSALLDGDGETTVGALMGPPLPTVSPDDALAAAEDLLVSDTADRIVVVDDGEAVGVVTTTDALAASPPRTGDGARDRRAVVTESGHSAAERAMISAGGADDGTETGHDAATTDAAESLTQGVCETCGALSPSLVTDNGQAVCPECTQV